MALSAVVTLGAFVQKLCFNVKCVAPRHLDVRVNRVSLVGPAGDERDLVCHNIRRTYVCGGKIGPEVDHCYETH